MVKLELGNAMKDVRISERLTDSAVCLVADEGDLDIHLERLLRQHRKLDHGVPRVLEVNPTHPVITALAGIVGADGAGTRVSDAVCCWIRRASSRARPCRTRPASAAA